MNINKKKTTRTPEQTKRRFYFACLLIAVMLATVVATRLKTSGGDESAAGERTLREAVLDAQLDSLLKSDCGPGAAATYTGSYSIIPMQSWTAVRIDYIEGRLRELASLKERDEARYTRLAAERDSLQALGLPRETDYYVRKVQYTDGGGKTYVAMQRADTALTRSTLIMKLELTDEKIRAAGEAMKEIIEDNQE